MIRRLTPLFVAIALVAAACSYESSGTTTTTTIDLADLPPATGPADIVVEDQRIEGTVVIVESVTMPSAGWVVVREDVGGAPGEVIGISDILREGVIARVPIPFFVPLADDTTIHVSVQIDIDRDGVFTYEPPNSLIDEIGTFANGSIASVTARIELLPPLQPSEVVLEGQRTDGTVITGASVVLPAPGFVALMTDADGAPGAILTVTGLLPAGSTDDLTFTPSPSLRQTVSLFVVAWIDRDENGAFDPEFDVMAVRIDGAIAQASVEIQVVPLEPTSVSAVDQEGDGASVTIAELTLPATGFVELLTDVDGQPGERLAIGAPRVAGTFDDITFELEEPLTVETLLWVRILIDFDEDGVPSDGDRVGLVAVGGAEAQATFTYRIAES
jgi:hypothetical protein